MVVRNAKFCSGPTVNDIIQGDEISELLIRGDSWEQSLAEKVIADGLMRARDEFIILMKL